MIQQTVRSEFSGVTVLVIAHRLETIADADQVIELQRGRVLRASTRQRTSRSSQPPVFEA